MALPISEFRLFKVGKPFLGEARPSEARADAALAPALLLRGDSTGG